ncbi:MAG: hypothetical protein IKP54_01500 [Bacteroidales bacterium]|nr:hypothetical protein [Bacteroidota bacterium]MBR6062825.1 hypothetical protein [Bacteroidales bacterium]
MEQEEKKKLNIIAIADNSEYGTSAIRHGGILAAIFKSTLTIITNFSFSKNKNQSENTPKEQLELTNQLIQNDIEVFLLSNPFSTDNIYSYADETNTIMFVIGVQRKGKDSLFNLRKARRFIKPSRLPVMTVGLKLPDNNIFRQVMLPLDIDRQHKEKALWAGYFSRFYHAKVHILCGSYKDQLLKQKVKDNIDFTKKLYQNLEIDYELHDFDHNIDDIDRFSIFYAPEIKASLTVIMMTSFYTFIDYIFGPKENAIIANEEGLPVLCINERDDLYVLCT